MVAADELFEAVVDEYRADPAITTAKMFGSPGLRVGGKVFATLVKGRLVVKLPRDRVTALVESGAGAHFDPGMGRLMKEWIAVGPSDEAAWLALAAEAREFVAAGAGR